MQTIFFIIMAILSVLIYRQGLKDGQMVSKGEQIKTAPKIPLKTKESAEQKRIIKGLRNIISYGMGSDKK